MRSIRLRRLVALGFVAAAMGPSVSGAAGVTDPTVTLDRTGTAIGDELLVTGQGWPKGATLIVELCGQGGIHGSVDCDVTNQRTAGVGPSGTFSTALTTGRPPSPCPCVVKATDQTSHIAATAAISVAGIATVPITEDDPDAVRRIEVSEIQVTGDRSWTELFGAPSPRVLDLTLVNTGAVAVQRPALTVAWGKGSAPTGFVKVPDLEPMEPGASQEVSIDLPRGALSFGQFRAVVEIQGLAEPVVAQTTSSTYPWGLVALAVLVLQLLLLRMRNRLRRRFQRRAAPPEVAPTDSARTLPKGAIAALPAAGTVIDLRDPVEVDLDAPVEEPVDVAEVVDVVEVVELPPSPAPSTNGHSTNGHSTNGHSTNGHSTDAGDEESHRATTAAITAELLTEFAAATAEMRQQVLELQQRARTSLQQSSRLSEALVSAAAIRADEVRATASERDEESQQRLTESGEVLAAARAAADELIAQATRAAEEIVAAATADREASRQALAEVDREREELAEAARTAIDRVLADLDERTAALTRDLEVRASALLASAGEERRAAPAYHDELDRRLARAVGRALATSQD
jgi:hypothetical protein